MKATRGGRFDPVTIAGRVEGLRILAGVDPKVIGPILWPNQKPENAARTWYKRAPQGRVHFKIPELEKAIDFLAAAAHRAGKIPSPMLPGFPFVDLFVALAIQSGDLHTRSQ